MVETLEAPEVERPNEVEDRTEALFIRFEHGDKLSPGEKDELIALLYRKAKSGQSSKGRICKHDSERLWLACQRIINGAKYFGLMGLHRDREQAEIHPLADEAALQFMQFLIEYEGPDDEFAAELKKRIRNRISAQNQTTVRRQKREAKFSGSEAGKYQLDPRFNQLKTLVHEEVAKLPAEQRRIIKQRLSSTTVSEIARRQGVTVQAIYERQRKAFDLLKTRLQPVWVEYLDLQSSHRLHKTGKSHGIHSKQG